jgi:hypothetical protein
MSTLRALENLFDREHELPAHATQVLKSIGWAFAQHMHDSGSSSTQNLRKQLLSACAGARGHVNWSDTCLDLVKRVTALPNEGWCLKRINGIVQDDGRDDSKLEFVYANKFKAKTHHSVHAAFRSHLNMDIVSFTLNGNQYYWFCGYNFCIVCRDWQDGVLEVVLSRSASVTYSCYAQQTNTCVAQTTFTTSLDTQLWMKRFWSSSETDEARQGVRGRYCPFKSIWMPRMETVVDFNMNTGLDDHPQPYTRLRQLKVGLEAITESKHLCAIMARRDTTHFPNLSGLLTKQLHARFARMASKLLYAKLQEAQERLASDPVKKCAACAVESVKSQLVLGIGAPKRKRNE